MFVAWTRAVGSPTRTVSSVSPRPRTPSRSRTLSRWARTWRSSRARAATACANASSRPSPSRSPGRRSLRASSCPPSTTTCCAPSTRPARRLRSAGSLSARPRSGVRARPPWAPRRSTLALRVSPSPTCAPCATPASRSTCGPSTTWSRPASLPRGASRASSRIARRISPTRPWRATGGRARPRSPAGNETTAGIAHAIPAVSHCGARRLVTPRRRGARNASTRAWPARAPRWSRPP